MASVLRSPGLDDAGTLGEVHVAAWQATYRGLMPDTDLDGQVRGFVFAGPARDDEAAGQGEVFALNVHPAA